MLFVPSENFSNTERASVPNVGRMGDMTDPFWTFKIQNVKSDRSERGGGYVEAI